MGNLIASMGDAESVLLLYLADELSTDDRAAVEQALAKDAALHDTLQRLRANLDQCDATLGRLDELDFPPAGAVGADADRMVIRLDRQAAVDRRAGEIVRQWIAEPRVASEPVRRRSRNAPLWTYPFAAAAAILLGFLIYWGRTSDIAPQVAHHDVAPSTRPAQPVMAASDAAAATNPSEDLAALDMRPMLFPQLGAGINNEQFNEKFMAYSAESQNSQNPEPAVPDRSNNANAPAPTQGNH